jgi:inner membrane protein
MTVKSHVVSACLIGSLPILMLPFDYETGVLYLMCLAAGAIVPDIDEYRSWIGKRMYAVSFIVHFGLGHRTLTHNYILGMSGALVSWFYFKNVYAVGFFVGMLTHILTDEMTGNVPGAYLPFSRRFSTVPKSMQFRVGSWQERVFLSVATLMLLGIHVYGVSRDV